MATRCAPFFAQQVIRPYDEQSGKGLVRHIFLRRGAHSGQIMVCLVCTRAKLPHAEQLCTALRGQFPAISTILLNVNAKNTNVILGSENHILYGPGYIEDTLCGVPVRLGPLSFYQVNTLAAERLYGVAAQYAQLTPDDTLLDLYCGMGTIGLSMAGQCRELIGVEIVPEAIESAKANAARMGEAVAAKSRFFCADAGQAATQLAAEGLHPDIVMLDPPAQGAAMRPPSPQWCAWHPAGWCMSAATPPPPPEMPHGWSRMGITQKRCSRWICSRGRNIANACS